jgi:hypothetical protein
MCGTSQKRRGTAGQADRIDTIAAAYKKRSRMLIDKIGGEMPFFVTCKCEFPIVF